jgi:hypothetical protein
LKGVTVMDERAAAAQKSTVSESISLRRRAMSAKSSSVQRWIKRFVVVVIVLAVGSMVGVLAITPRPAEIESAAVVVAEEASMRRSIDAYAARYTGLAEHYTTASHSSPRGMDAYAARYTGMAAQYSPPEDTLQRSRDAYAARLTGLAEDHAAKSHSSQRGMNAYAARYTGLAEQYATTGHSSPRGMDAYAARYTGLAAVAKHHTGKPSSSQRAIDAYGARCTGIADHYAAIGK